MNDSVASFPFCLGGLGIRKLEDLAAPAYFSSLYKNQDLSNKIIEKLEINKFNTKITNFEKEIEPIYVPETLVKKKVLQKNWDFPKIIISSLFE